MKGWRIYLLLALLVVLLIGFILAGKYSPSYVKPVTQTINCNSVSLSFSAIANKSISAPEGTNTFFEIPVNNTGNVTETISISVSPKGSVPFTMQSAPAFQLNVSKAGYTSFGVYSPTKTGNYSIIANVSAGYLNCVNYKLLPINVTVINASS